jgi:hypothetical protein
LIINIGNFYEDQGIKGKEYRGTQKDFDRKAGYGKKVPF